MKILASNQNEKTTAGVLLFKRVINNCLTCKIFCISFYTIIKLNVNKNGFLSKASFNIVWIEDLEPIDFGIFEHIDSNEIPSNLLFSYISNEIT